MIVVCWHLNTATEESPSVNSLLTVAKVGRALWPIQELLPPVVIVAPEFQPIAVLFDAVSTVFKDCWPTPTLRVPVLAPTAPYPAKAPTNVLVLPVWKWPASAPTKVLLVLATLNAPDPAPRKVFCEPVVNLWPAPEPIQTILDSVNAFPANIPMQTLKSSVVNASPASGPIITFDKPCVTALPASLPINTLFDAEVAAIPLSTPIITLDEPSCNTLPALKPIATFPVPVVKPASASKPKLVFLLVSSVRAILFDNPST